MNIVDQLIEHEGIKLTAYTDSLGFLTIGIGRLIDPHKTKEGISRNEAITLCLNDVTKRQHALDLDLSWWVKLNDVRQNVLLDMSFQMGVQGLLGFHRTLEFVRIGEYSQAADSMLQSKWAKFDSPKRAQRLASMMRLGVDVTKWW